MFLPISIAQGPHYGFRVDGLQLLHSRHFGRMGFCGIRGLTFIAVAAIYPWQG